MIHTDPKNTAYVVVEGAKKQDTGEDSGTGVIRVKPLPGEEDAESAGVMGKLEKAAEEAKRKAIDEPRIEELRRLSERQWADPYEHSRKMRKIFRVCVTLHPPLLSKNYPALLFSSVPRPYHQCTQCSTKCPRRRKERKRTIHEFIVSKYAALLLHPI